MLHNTLRKSAIRPLEMVHIDVMEPICPMFYHGKEYIPTFADDFAHFKVACLIKSNDQVTNYFQMQTAMALSHFNFPLNLLCSDNGGESLK